MVLVQSSSSPVVSFTQGLSLDRWWCDGQQGNLSVSYAVPRSVSCYVTSNGATSDSEGLGNLAALFCLVLLDTLLSG